MDKGCGLQSWILGEMPFFRVDTGQCLTPQTSTGSEQCVHSISGTQAQCPGFEVGTGASTRPQRLIEPLPGRPPGPQASILPFFMPRLPDVLSSLDSSVGKVLALLLLKRHRCATCQISLHLSFLGWLEKACQKVTVRAPGPYKGVLRHNT